MKKEKVALVRYILNMDHLLKVWELERKRFEVLYDHLLVEQLNDVVKTSPLHRRVGEYVPCMLLWLEAGLEYFQGKSGDWKHLDVTTFTNTKLGLYNTVSCAVVWEQLHKADNALRKILQQMGEKSVFPDPNAWSWIIWCGPGHYDEHSSQVEAHLAGKTVKPEAVQWFNSYIRE